MDAVNALCFLVMRLTPKQRDVLYQVSLTQGQDMPPGSIGVLAGLEVLGLVVCSWCDGLPLRRLSRLGEDVIAVLTDTVEDTR